ncbi:MAG: hypothetical protein ACRCV9_11390 [Burkholderiaceae bacterium]
MPLHRSHLTLPTLALAPVTALAHEGHEHFFGDADHVWPFVFAAAVIAIGARIILKRRAASKARKERD